MSEAQVVSLEAFKKARQECEEVSEEIAGTPMAMSGQAQCLACHHNWIAVVSAPAFGFECPSCHLMRGQMMFEISLPDGVMRLACIHCHGQAYQLTTLGTFCLGCGAYHSWDSTPKPA